MKQSAPYIRKRQFKPAKSRYLETILQAIGQAGAAGYKSHIDTLFAMSHEIMGLTSPAKSDTMQSGAGTTGTNRNGGKTMKITVNGELLGTVLTNRSLTIEEALWTLGYDLNDAADMERGYNNDVPGFYLDDCGNYQFDIDAVKMEY